LPPGPGPLGGAGVGRFQLAIPDVPEQPHRRVEVSDLDDDP
jgi:hypothetical protein